MLTNERQLQNLLILELLYIGQYRYGNGCGVVHLSHIFVESASFRFHLGDVMAWLNLEASDIF